MSATETPSLIDELPYQLREVARQHDRRGQQVTVLLYVTLPGAALDLSRRALAADACLIYFKFWATLNSFS